MINEGSRNAFSLTAMILEHVIIFPLPCCEVVLLAEVAKNWEALGLPEITFDVIRQVGEVETQIEAPSRSPGALKLRWLVVAILFVLEFDVLVDEQIPDALGDAPATPITQNRCHDANVGQRNLKPR